MIMGISICNDHERYGLIGRYLATTKHDKAQTVCIFLRLKVKDIVYNISKGNGSLWYHMNVSRVDHWINVSCNGPLAKYVNCGLRECQENFLRHRFQRKPLVSDPGMHRGTCVTHVPWCMSGSSTRRGGENVTGIPGACGTLNFAYLVRGPMDKCVM